MSFSDVLEKVCGLPEKWHLKIFSMGVQKEKKKILNYYLTQPQLVHRLCSFLQIVFGFFILISLRLKAFNYLDNGALKTNWNCCVLAWNDLEVILYYGAEKPSIFIFCRLFQVLSKLFKLIFSSLLQSLRRGKVWFLVVLTLWVAPKINRFSILDFRYPQHYG